MHAPRGSGIPRVTLDGKLPSPFRRGAGGEVFSPNPPRCSLFRQGRPRTRDPAGRAGRSREKGCLGRLLRRAKYSWEATRYWPPKTLSGPMRTLLAPDQGTLPRANGRSAGDGCDSVAAEGLLFWNTTHPKTSSGPVPATVVIEDRGLPAKIRFRRNPWPSSLPIQLAMA